MSTDSWIRKVAELRQLLETKDVNSSDITTTDDAEIAATNMLYIQKQQQQHSNAPSQQEETKGNNNKLGPRAAAGGPCVKTCTVLPMKYELLPHIAYISSTTRRPY